MYILICTSVACCVCMVAEVCEMLFLLIGLFKSWYTSVEVMSYYKLCYQRNNARHTFIKCNDYRRTEYNKMFLLQKAKWMVPIHRNFLL